MLNDNDYLPILTRRDARDGSYHTPSTYLGYADEARPFPGVDAIEVLAQVPGDASLPDNFEQSDVKYGRVKYLFEAPFYPRKSAWQAELRKVAVFILDPTSIVSAITTRLVGSERIQLASTSDTQRIANEVAARIALLHPASWVQSLDLMDGSMIFGIGDLDAFVRSQDEELKAARSRKGDYLVNLRRRILRSQALNREILEYQPFRISNEDGSIDVKLGSLQIRELALSLGAKMVYDKGHSADISRLLHNQIAKEHLVSPLSQHFRLPKIGEHCVQEVDSKDSELVQLADFAAGLAADMYADGRKRDELVHVFAEVFVNGVSMQR